MCLSREQTHGCIFNNTPYHFTRFQCCNWRYEQSRHKCQLPTCHRYSIHNELHQWMHTTTIYEEGCDGVGLGGLVLDRQGLGRDYHQVDILFYAFHSCLLIQNELLSLLGF